MAEEEVDILVELQGLQQFVASTGIASRAMEGIGEAAVASGKLSEASGLKSTTAVELIGKTAKSSAVSVTAASNVMSYAMLKVRDTGYRVAGGIKDAFKGAFISAEESAILAGVRIRRALSFSGVKSGIGSLVSGITGALSGVANSAMASSEGGGGPLAAIGGVVQTIAGAGLALYGWYKASQDTMESLVGLSEAAGGLHKVAGVSTQDAATLIAVANAWGISNQQLSLGLKSIATTSAGASAGTKSDIALYKELGISMSTVKSQGGNMEQFLGTVIDHFNAMPPGVDKTAAAVKLFGRNWQQMLPFISQGSTALKQQQAEAKAYGVTLGGDPVKNAEKLKEAQVQLALATTGLKVQFAEKLAPALITVLDWGIKLWHFLAAFLAPVFRAFKPLLADVAKWFDQNKKTIQKVLVDLGKAAVVMAKAMVDAVKLIVWWFKNVLVPIAKWMVENVWIPVIGRMVTIFKGAAQGIEDAANGISNFFKGSTWSTMWTVITAPFKFIASIVVPLFTGIITEANNVNNFFKNPTWANLGAILSAPFNTAIGVANTLLNAWNSIKNFFGGGTFTAGGQFPQNLTPQTSGLPVGPVSTVGPIAGAFGQHGAIVTRPTWSLIGEAGIEAVVPLDRMPGAGPLPSNVGTPTENHIHVHVEIARREIARAVGKYLDDRMARR